jgi:hypothetical protein
MLKHLKNKILSYFLGKDIENQLKTAKDDAQRVKILMDFIGDKAEEMAQLTEENKRLKAELEDNASIFSSGSSLSNESINSKVEKRKKEIYGLINNSKKSTAHLRTEIKLLNKIQELQHANELKDQEIKQLTADQVNNTSLDSLQEEINKLNNEVKGVQALIEVKK